MAVRGCCWVMQCSVPRPSTRSLDAMPIGGTVTDASGFVPGPRSGRAAGSAAPGRFTTTTVASRAIPSGSRHWGRSARLSAPIRKKRSSDGRSARRARRVSTL